MISDILVVNFPWPLVEVWSLFFPIIYKLSNDLCEISSTCLAEQKAENMMNISGISAFPQQKWTKDIFDVKFDQPNSWESANPQQKQIILNISGIWEFGQISSHHIYSLSGVGRPKMPSTETSTPFGADGPMRGYKWNTDPLG